ncbi:response regulator [Geminicoccus roseus]|uniref:response regulator n=1 Tax=Geminicoccus roseus TaxID=404900 RepID=UPI0003F5ACE7|nr:response regulator [Geminicoccus roseus]
MAEGRSSAVVLLVEDDPVISLDTSMTLQDMGVARVDATFTLEEADAAINRETPSLALMDIDLRGVTSFALAERLVALGVPCVFTTGHGQELPVPPSLKGTLVITKPYDPAQLRTILRPYLHPPADEALVPPGKG